MPYVLSCLIYNVSGKGEMGRGKGGGSKHGWELPTLHL